jgi:hypothetical protein
MFMSSHSFGYLEPFLSANTLSIINIYDLQKINEIMNRQIIEFTTKRDSYGRNLSKYWLHLTLLNFTDRMMIVFSVLGPPYYY